MGYTHYLTRHGSWHPLQYAKWQRMALTLLEERPATARENYFGLSELPLNVCGPDGTGAPEVTATTFAFNGDTNQYLPPPSDEYPWGIVDAAHESFRVDLEDEGWTFCKTAQKPYDLLVCACLLALKFVFPEVEVGSDGGPDDWAAAVHFFEQTFEIPASKGGPWVADEAA